MAIFKSIDPRLSRYDHLVVHCTATRADQKNVDAKWVDRAHKKRGWSGCGYHAVITREGKLEMFDEGFSTRPVDKTGAHVGGCGAGWNGRSFGVTLAGGINSSGKPENNFTKRQFSMLAKLIKAFLASHETPDKVTIMGHRDLIRMTGAPAKACPCFDVSSYLVEYKIYDDEDVLVEEDDSPLILPSTYVVKRGESLWKIANTYGVSVTAIKSINGLVSNVIKTGQELKLEL